MTYLQFQILRSKAFGGEEAAEDDRVSDEGIEIGREENEADFEGGSDDYKYQQSQENVLVREVLLVHKFRELLGYRW